MFLTRWLRPSAISLSSATLPAGMSLIKTLWAVWNQNSRHFIEIELFLMSSLTVALVGQIIFFPFHANIHLIITSLLFDSLVRQMDYVLRLLSQNTSRLSRSHGDDLDTIVHLVRCFSPTNVWTNLLQAVWTSMHVECSTTPCTKLGSLSTDLNYLRSHLPV